MQRFTATERMLKSPFSMYLSRRSTLALGGHPAYGFHWWAPPGTPVPTVGLHAHQFELGGTKVEAYATCRNFVRLLGELIAAFETTHPRP